LQWEFTVIATRHWTRPAPCPAALLAASLPSPLGDSLAACGGAFTATGPTQQTGARNQKTNHVAGRNTRFAGVAETGCLTAADYVVNTGAGSADGEALSATSQQSGTGDKSTRFFLLHFFSTAMSRARPSP